ncbi:MAG: Hpt domain-containing protein [Spirochaetaceae bacterium]|nr:Hpt domain-containing protein [Spirochaetaceae bacterium]MCF7948636.1 Hpt domain-containing protein [Spirochaetia bacterium]MCF7950696.1 Hpt domain-containing protein [Spirochaetaceae bacterium]
MELEHTILYGSMKDLQLQIEALKQNFADSDYHSLARSAHALKGTSGNLSALRLYASAEQLEAAAKAIIGKGKQDVSPPEIAENSEEQIDQLIKLTEKQFIEYNTLIQTEYPH